MDTNDTIQRVIVIIITIPVVIVIIVASIFYRRARVLISVMSQDELRLSHQRKISQSLLFKLFLPKGKNPQLKVKPGPFLS